MELHRVRRLTGVLLASELRGGRSTSDPTSLLGRPVIVPILDAAAFLLLFGLTHLALVALGTTGAASFDAVGRQLLLLLPVVAVAVVLVAGVLFEFSASARFASSDAVNWLPVAPGEYVAASAFAVALLYSTPVAFVLGAGLAFALALGVVPTYLLATGLAAVALLEGGALIEIVRSTTQRAAAAFSGRRGKVALAARAAIFVVAILALELAFNPVLLLGALDALAGFGTVAAFVPFFWATASVGAALAGELPAAAAFAVGQVLFVALLFVVAARLRVRFWAPAPAEVTLEAHVFGGPHPLWGALGLAPREASLAAKDLMGLVRRREMLPMLVMPLVLALLGFLEATPAGGGGFDRMTMTLWVAWVPGFAALLLAMTSIGQERRAIVRLLAFPLDGRALFRAKASVPLLLGTVVAVGIGLPVAFLFPLAPPALVALAGTAAASVLLGTFLGLSIALRYPDFQERPRARFVQTWPMIGGMLGGIATIYALAIPALGWMFAAHPFAGTALVTGAAVLAAAVAAVAVSFVTARRGADVLLRELPV